jgi:hypothetical protein
VSPSDQTVSPGDQTTPIQKLEVRSLPWAVRPPEPALLLHHLLHQLCPPHSCDAHDFSCVPCGALDSTRTTHGPDVYDYSRTTRGPGALPAPLLALPSGYVRATDTTSTSAVTVGEGHTGSTSGESSSDDHEGEAGLPTDRLTLSATLAPTLSLVPSSIRAALIDLNWCCAMEEEFAGLIANNT